MLGKDPSFSRVFAEDDIAEPLASVAEGEADRARMLFEQRNFDVIGYEEEGRVIGFLEKEQVADFDNLKRSVQKFEVKHLISENTDLLECLKLLQEKNRLFVINKSEVDAIVTLADIQKPAVRMLFFGIITFFEKNASRLIQEFFPDNSWMLKLPDHRREKAETTYQKLIERNTEIDLISCTQLSDKAGILEKDDSLRERYVQLSKTKAGKFFNRIIRLRDDLAHAQSLTIWFEEKEVTELMSELIRLTERINTMRQ